jgi:hypothetical protein
MRRKKELKRSNLFLGEITCFPETEPIEFSDREHKLGYFEIDVKRSDQSEFIELGQVRPGSHPLLWLHWFG